MFVIAAISDLPPEAPREVLSRDKDVRLERPAGGLLDDPGHLLVADHAGDRHLEPVGGCDLVAGHRPLRCYVDDRVGVAVLGFLRAHDHALDRRSPPALVPEDGPGLM